MEVSKLPSHEITEILTFIAETKNSNNLKPDKSEVYEIIREKQYDEKSRILELKKFGGANFSLDVGSY